MENEAFHQWVADAIDDCGGSGAQYLQGLRREWSLTSCATRMVDCQPPAAVFFTDRNAALERFAAIALTDLTAIH